jgi:uncharacterized membrane protein
MPFCTQCGGQVQPSDPFCGACGARQNGTPPPPSPPGGQGREGARPKSADPVNDRLKDLTPRNASLLCYIPFVGWLIAIVVLASTRFQHDRQVRFHAFQGLYLFVLWLFMEWVFGPMVRSFGGIFFAYRLMLVVYRVLQVGVIGAWVFMIVKTSQGENYRLPLLGDLADKSVAEQK